MTFSDAFTIVSFIFSILLLLNTIISNILLKEIEKESKALLEDSRKFLQELNLESEDNE